MTLARTLARVWIGLILAIFVGAFAFMLVIFIVWGFQSTWGVWGGLLTLGVELFIGLTLWAVYLLEPKPTKPQGVSLSTQEKTALRAWHDEVGYSCAAASEGLACCVDVLLGDAPDPLGTRHG